VKLLTDAFFNEFTIRVPGKAEQIVEKLAAKGVLGGVPYDRLAPNTGHDDLILVAATEVTTNDDRAALAKALGEVVS
jgi:glycine dehydrogenase subunit 1